MILNGSKIYFQPAVPTRTYSARQTSKTNPTFSQPRPQTKTIYSGSKTTNPRSPTSSTTKPAPKPATRHTPHATQNTVNFNLAPEESEPYDPNSSFDPIGDLFSNPTPAPPPRPLSPTSPQQAPDQSTEDGFTFDDFATDPYNDPFNSSPQFLAPPVQPLARSLLKEKVGSPKGSSHADNLFDSFSNIKDDPFKPTKTTTFHQTTNFKTSNNRGVPSRSFESPSLPPPPAAQSRSPPTSRLSRTPPEHHQAPNYSYSENYTSESGHFHQTPYSNESDIRASSSVPGRSRSQMDAPPVKRGAAPSRSKIGDLHAQSRSLSSRNIPPPAPKAQPSQPDRRERSRPPRGLVSRSRDPGTGGPNRSRDPISESRDPARSREPHPRRGNLNPQVPEEHDRTSDQIPHRSRHRSLDPGPELNNNVQTVDREVSDVRKNRRGANRRGVRAPTRTRRHHAQEQSEPLENIKEHEEAFAAPSNSAPLVADPNRESHGKPPHAFVRFGFGGKMLRIRPYKSRKGKFTVSISTVQKELTKSEFIENMEKFPGPITEKKEKPVLEFLQRKVATPSDPTADSQTQSTLKLWKLMNTMYCVTEPKSIIRDMITIVLDGNIPPPSIAPEFSKSEIAKARRELNNALFQGNSQAAVKVAIQHHLWADAFAISLKCCPKLQSQVLAAYGKSFAMTGPVHSPMHTLCLATGGKGDELTTDLVKQPNCNWTEHAAVLLSNLCRESQGTLQSLGTKLWKSGDCPSGHVCYICGGVALEKEKCPIRLLGGNHQNGKCVNWQRVQAIQLTEMYEAAKKKRDPMFKLPLLQVYKLAYARYLAEVGLAEEALQYCDVITVELGKMGKPEFAQMGRSGQTIKKDVEELSNRLKIFLNKKSVGAAVTGLASTIGSYFFSSSANTPEKIVCEKAWLPRKKADVVADSPGSRGTRQVRRGATRQVKTKADPSRKGDPTRAKRGVRINDQPSGPAPAEVNTKANRGRRPSIQNDADPPPEKPSSNRHRTTPRQKAEPRRPRRQPTEKSDPAEASPGPQRARFDPVIQRRPMPRTKKEVRRAARSRRPVRGRGANPTPAEAENSEEATSDNPPANPPARTRAPARRRGPPRRR